MLSTIVSGSPSGSARRFLGVFREGTFSVDARRLASVLKAGLAGRLSPPPLARAPSTAAFGVGRCRS